MTLLGQTSLKTKTYLDNPIEDNEADIKKKQSALISGCHHSSLMGENCKQIASCYNLNPVFITQQLVDRASAVGVAVNYFLESQLRTHFYAGRKAKRLE